MDARLRALERRAAGGDLEAARRLLVQRGRVEATRVRGCHRVGGPVLGDVLRTALVATGAREIELLGADVHPLHRCRYIRALRDLMAGRPRSWLWVERWAPALGVGPEELDDWRRLAERFPPKFKRQSAPR